MKFVLSLVAVLLLVGQIDAQPRTLTAIEIQGLPGFDSSIAVAINNSGQIIGRSFPNTPFFPTQQRSFLWDSGVITDLGSLGGARTEAFAINNRGQVVGVSETSAGELHAFLWERGTMIDLGTLGGFSRALGINDRGQVVGESDVTLGETHAFLWDNGVMVDLGVPAGFADSTAHAINNRGEVVGSASFFLGSTISDAFLWRDGGVEPLETLPVVTVPPIRSSVAVDINDRGIVAGVSNFRAVIWIDGTVQALDTFPFLFSAEATGINNRGQVVGAAAAFPAPAVAFLWEGGTFTVLPLPFTAFMPRAEALNDRGEIVGSVRTADGRHHAVLWTSRQNLLNVALP